MLYTINFAKIEEESVLRDIFMSVDMDLVGCIDDHVVIRENGVLRGGGLLYQMDHSSFHLLTMAVVQGDRGRGTGSLLLKRMLEHPWVCCRDAVMEQETEYRVTTVARGSSRGFYLKNGLVDCHFNDLEEPFDRQCLACPDVDQCNSVGMEYYASRTFDAVPRSQECRYVM